LHCGAWNVGASSLVGFREWWRHVLALLLQLNGS
jgi:hypothetical protein